MALDQGISAVLEIIAGDINTLEANVGVLAGLDTTDKTNLVDAINEVLAAVGSGGTIDADSITDATVTGKALIRATDGLVARTAIGAGTSNLAIGTTGTTAKAGDYQPTAANISDSTAVGRSVLTAADALAARTAIGAATQTDITNAIAALVGGAGAAYDTLVEIEALLQSNDGSLAALTTAVNNRVRYDAAQSLDNTQKTQARTNIGAYGSTEIGNPDTDFVAVYNAARA